RADVLLRAGVDHAELRDVDRPREDVRGHVHHQRHLTGVRHPVELHAADGFVAAVMQVGSVLAQLPVVLPGDGEEVQRLAAGRHVDVAKATRFLDGLLRPDAGLNVVGHAVFRQQVQRNLGELLAGPALHEQHLVVLGNAQQVAQVLFGLLGDADELVAAVAHLHHRQAAALPVEKFRLGALQYGGRKRGGAGAEVMGSFAHVWTLSSRKPAGPASLSRAGGAPAPLRSLLAVCGRLRRLVVAGDVCLGSAVVFVDDLVVIATGGLLDPLQADQLLVLGQLDEDHALSVAARTADLVDAGPHQGALVGDQHDLLAFLHLNGADQRAVALVDDHGDHALAATTTARELAQFGALAVAALGSGEDLRAGFRNQHGDQALAFRQTHAAHAAGGPAHRTDQALGEAQHLAAAGKQHDLAGAVGDGGGDQGVAFVQAQGDQAARTRTAELRQRGLLDGTEGGGHEDVGTGRFGDQFRGVAIGVLGFGLDDFALDHRSAGLLVQILLVTLALQRLEVDLQHRGDALALFQRKQVDQRTAARGARGLGDLEGTQPVDLALAGEQQQGGVAVGDQQVLDVVLVLHAGGRLALAAAALGLVGGERLALRIAAVGDGHHALFLGD